MYYSIYPSADTWISSGSQENGISMSYSEQNFGQDPILEIKKEFIQGEFKYPTRALINFRGTDLTAVSQSIVDGDIVNPKFSLRLYETEGISDLSTEYNIVAYPLSESWDEGIGKFGDVTKEGCSWEWKSQYSQDGLSESWSRMGYPDDKLGGTWHQDPLPATASCTVEITAFVSLGSDTLTLTDINGKTHLLDEGGSSAALSWDAETSNTETAKNLNTAINNITLMSASRAGTINTIFQIHPGAAGNVNPIASDAVGWTIGTMTGGLNGEPVSASKQTFSYESPDINMDVSDMVEGWFSQSISNHGLILKFSGSKETDNTQTGKLKFFSRNTHTIYPPKLEVKWDDHKEALGANTGSLSHIDTTGDVKNYVYVKGLRDRYKETEKVRFRIGARPTIIEKTTSTTYNDTTSSFVPEGSGSYSIVDVSTGDTLIPFDDIYTQLSCDTKGSYFNQWLNTFQPNRVYKILIKVKYEDKQEIIYDDNFEFKIVR